MPVLPPRRLLTAEQAADYCGFESVQGFRAHIKVPPLKFGRNVLRYDRQALDDYLDRLRDGPGVRPGRMAELVGHGNRAAGRH